MRHRELDRKNNFYVITGGPGAGKTTLLNALGARGFNIIPEDARKIIKQQTDMNGEGLPWKNARYFTHLMLEASVRSYEAIQDRSEAIHFFDRGIPDTLCYADMIGLGISAEMDRTAKKCPYNSIIFMLPPWPEIYQTDEERKQSWEEAVFTYTKMKETYIKYGYELVEVPKDEIENRVRFVIDKIRL
ncbi:ATPase [Pedobacter lusitanus]|uniref:ATPase n=1 Tax=Pedobacter lusitanus TaxID=1503925 RepID=A0A0D0GQ33_9SPHI|nr:AAA family ATPase [Pedobacter lusitanus]KIO78275.1 ATPase [Pedobacter lusitanus]